jgi:hypothetical protein
MKSKPARTKSQKIAINTLVVLGVTILISILLSVLFGQGNTDPIFASQLFNTFAVIIIAEVLVLYLTLFGFIADMAAKKGRSWAAFFWLSLLVTPLIMLIIAASISPIPGSVAYVTPEGKNPADKDQLDETVQLRKLAELRDSGILTKAEFEAKKKELLDRI